jgi:processive 1,2-diacylglycerol beta-glucosyltransferase
MKKILLLTSSTGGGHDMRARSFSQWVTAPAAAALDLCTTGHQALENGGALYAFGAGLYNFIQRFRPSLHHIYFNVLEAIPFCGSAKTMPGRAAFQALIRREAPAIVLSTHDHLNHAFLEAARAAMPESPPLCGTYCGELSGGYGFSKHWVNPRADFFIAATDACLAEARRLGMPPEKSWLGGFMLKPDFWTPQPADARDGFLRGELGLDPAAFTLLLGTGANGANNHTALLAAFPKVWATLPRPPLPFPQILALCGGNDPARRAVEAWAAAHPEVPVRALARRDDMRRVLAGADILFARPGTGSTSEAIQSGVPIIFNGIGGVMPQELITVRYCRRFFAADVVRRPAALPLLIAALLRSPARLQEIRLSLASARPTGHPLQILQNLTTLTPAHE